ncbi:cytochrome c biogenesis protein CcsA [Coprobacter sp.]
MKKKCAFFVFFTSYKLMLILLSLYAVLLAAATLIGSHYGSPAARAVVYNNILFYLLQLFLIGNFVGISLKARLWKQRKYGVLMFHWAFAVVLVGALITRVWGYEGIVHVREGEQTSQMLTRQNYISGTAEYKGHSVSFEFPIEINSLFTVSFSEKIRLEDITVDMCLNKMKYSSSQDMDHLLELSLSIGTDECIISLFGRDYQVGEPVNVKIGDVDISIAYGAVFKKLPFSVRLRDFRLVRYPGSQSPSSFESDLILVSKGSIREEKIYMNKVLYEQNYRLYQSSYDVDEQGTVLSVNNDTFGTIVTYIGYIMLLLGMILTFAQDGSRFRILHRQLSYLTGSRKTIIMFFLIVVSGSVSAQEISIRELQKNAPPVSLADQWGRLQVQNPSGRIEPVDTYTATLLRKIYRKDFFHGMTSEQVILGFIFDAGYWNRVPVIRQTNSELHKLLGTSGNEIAFYDLFENNGVYKLAGFVGKIHMKPTVSRSRLEKDILKLDEKVNILYALQQGKMFALFPCPEDKDGKWISAGDDLSVFSGKDSLFVSKIMLWYGDELVRSRVNGDWKIPSDIVGMMDVYQKAQSRIPVMTSKQLNTELFYNKANLFFVSAIGYLLSGILLFAAMMLFRIKPSLNRKIAVYFLNSIVVLFFLLQTCGIGLRWYISGQAPWSNAYESMIYIGWTTLLAGLLFARRSGLVLALAAFFAGIILFVADLNWMDPEITPLVPVLKSYWLMIHVAVITASYGFFGMSFLIGVLTMFFIIRNNKSAEVRELRIINEMSLHIGVCLLTAGTFLGAVWANESWGRYWGWDPKETWALITLIVYAIIIHARFLPRLRSDYAFSVLSVYGVLSVLMTYFGVNYYLSGLHSYGSGDVPPAVDIIGLIYVAITVLAVVAARKKNKIPLLS